MHAGETAAIPPLSSFWGDVGYGRNISATDQLVFDISNTYQLVCRVQRIDIFVIEKSVRLKKRSARFPDSETNGRSEAVRE